MTEETRKERGLCELYAEDPERADALLFGRVAYPDRRGFLKGAGLAAMAAMCVAPVMPGQKLPINVDTDLTPIANIVGVYNMLVFGKHVPFRTVPELIEQAKKNPGKISYASAGNGTSQHLAGEMFKKLEKGIVRGEIALPYGIEDAIANMRVIDALFRSERSGRWEDVGRG